MNKALLLSIKPEHAIKILNGEKTLELRKSVPKGFKGWVYVYVSNGVGKTKYHHLYNLTKYNNGKTLFSITHHNKHSLVPDGFLNGKVVFRFWFDKYEKLKLGRWVNHKVGDWNYRGYMDEHLETFKKACLTEEEVNNYGDGKDLYAWHIKQLDIFYEPMRLSEFYKQTFLGDETLKYQYRDDIPEEDTLHEIYLKPLTKAPQSYQYVWVKEELK